jgi:hypothetical protein
MTKQKFVEKITFILLGYGGVLLICGLLVLPFNRLFRSTSSHQPWQ